ncbi:MAG: hypothetical protein ISS69_08935 [Phycisphaerae bacterium]|nr:hypothetical protein [Planctomycetota bacterium]MBL7220226.1 hypothetical protein [Phycisphaerae bacterium]
MYEEMRVKYLFINLKYSAYVKLQGILIAVWTIAALPCFLYLKDSSIWMLKHVWWLCLVVALLEGVEAFLAIGKAKRDFHRPAGNDTA